VAGGPGNGKSPLAAPAFQELHLIFATITSTYGLVIGAPRICQSAKLLSQFSLPYTMSFRGA
jgi:hypothetical protein